MLFIEGASDAIIRKMTGHRSEELERYKHLSPEFSKQTTELIAGKLVEELENTSSGTFWSQSPENEKAAQRTARKTLIIKRLMAEPTGLEPATSNVTGWRSNQLNYDSAVEFLICDLRLIFSSCFNQKSKFKNQNFHNWWA
jgi:hypothetical protein